MDGAAHQRRAFATEVLGTQQNAATDYSDYFYVSENVCMGYWHMYCAEWFEHNEKGERVARHCVAVTCSDDWHRKHDVAVELATDGTRRNQAWYCGLRSTCRNRDGKKYVHECEAKHRGAWCALLEITQRIQAPNGEWTLQTRCFRVPSAPNWVRDIKAAHVARRAEKFFGRDARTITPLQLYSRKTVAAALTRGGLVWRDDDCAQTGPPSPPRQLDRLERP